MRRKPDLQEVVRRACEGDLNAFEELVRRFQHMAYAYALAVIGNADRARDVAQEAFIEAYRQIGSLRSPRAFSQWFRRIVFKHCDRILRDRAVQVAGLDAESLAAHGDGEPGVALDRRQLHERVQAAIRALPEGQRSVVNLFYMNGYSCTEVAEFLEVPVTTIKKRLHDARKKLKVSLMSTVRESLREHVPDSGFPRWIIDELLHRPRLLEIEDHPVRRVWDSVRASLAGWEVVEGPEVETDEMYRSVKAQMDAACGGAYYVEGGRRLRPHTTRTTFLAVRGRKAPVRLLTAGRVFRQTEEDPRHSRVFHQVDGICIDAGAAVHQVKETCQSVLRAILGNADLRWVSGGFGFVDHALELHLKWRRRWIEIGGCGTLKPAMLREAGHDPEAVSGYAFGLGLERLAMVHCAIDDQRKLWQAPYVKT